jgi:threonine dehydratase
VPEQPTWSTSTAGGVEPGAITLALGQRVIDRQVLVTEDEIVDAARRLEREDGEPVEGAAAVAVAAFLKTAGDYGGKTVALLLCGGNAEPEFEAKIRER